MTLHCVLTSVYDILVYSDSLVAVIYYVRNVHFAIELCYFIRNDLKDLGLGGNLMLTFR
jgi:hypothetical protein